MFLIYTILGIQFEGFREEVLSSHLSEGDLRYFKNGLILLRHRTCLIFASPKILI